MRLIWKEMMISRTARAFMKKSTDQKMGPTSLPRGADWRKRKMTVRFVRVYREGLYPQG